MKTTLL